MRPPIEVTVDPEWPVGYVRYLPESAEHDGALALVRDADGVVRDHPFCELDYHWKGVLIDVTPDDEIIGFEITNVDDAEKLALAREYAADNDLAFPEDVRAAMTARDPAA